MMNGESRQFEFLDVLAITSFAMQLSNQNKLFSLEDIKRDNNRILTDVQNHLHEQDKKIDEILMVIGGELGANYREA